MLLLCLVLPGQAGAQSVNVRFRNPNPIVINDAAPATPYPSTINVSGLPGLVSRVTVTLTNLYHSFPDDLEILLVSPSGQTVLLMSDAGGGYDVTNAILTLDDNAIVSLPDNGPIVTGTYRPSNYTASDDPEVFYEPAPGSPYGRGLRDLNGSPPNGLWSLYVVDDAGSDAGGIAGGWSIRLSTVDVSAVADLSLALTDLQDPVKADDKLVYRLLITNQGPFEARGVVLYDFLPSNADYLFAIPSQGSCSNSNGVVVCSLGTLALDDVVSVLIGASPTAPGAFTNRASVFVTAGADFNPANSSATELTTALPAETADLVVTTVDVPDPALLGLNLSYTVSVLNRGPLDATGVVLSDTLPVNVALMDVQSSQGSCNAAGGTVVCALGDLTNNGVATVTLIVRPSSLGFMTNVATAIANEFDLSPENATVRTSTLVYIPTDLSVRQLDSRDPASVNSNLTYTVYVYNNGPGAATGVMLSNVLPVSSTFVSVATSQGSCANLGGWLSCNLGSLNPGAQAIVAITVRPTMLGKFFNMATVYASEEDPDHSNDYAAESTDVFPGGNGIVILPSTNAVELANAITAAGSTGIRVKRATLQAHTMFITNWFGDVYEAWSSGLYSVVNSPYTYGLRGLGVVISSGSVLDYMTGPSISQSTTTPFLAQATTNQEVLLDPITASTNSNFTHYDVTQLDIEFDLLPGYESVLFNVVFGSEEYPRFVNSSFIDGFGIYLNGVNIAYTRGKPVNINHPDMRSYGGTELNGVLAPNGNPILTFSKFVGSGVTNNRLTFIVSDTSDSVLDTTVFVSSLQGTLPPNADLGLQMSGPTTNVVLGSNVTYRLTVTNRGPDMATVTVLSNVLPAGMAFVSAVPSQGNCTYVDGVVICDLFNVDRNYGATVTIVGVPLTEITLTNWATVSASQVDFGRTNNAATNLIQAIPYGNFVNPAAILINDGAPAGPYPAVIDVFGLEGRITNVTVTLRKLSHAYPSDLDILLVGPAGDAVVLMSDAGANFPLSDVTLTFSDHAPTNLPQREPILSGTYRPTNFDPPDFFFEPAPPGPYGTALSVFHGSHPNGPWQFFGYDDMGQDAGLIYGGWRIAFGLEPVPVEPPVLLTITRIGGQLVLSWPATSPDCQVESNAQLSSGAGWVTLTNHPAALDGCHTITLDASGQAGFFRLRKGKP